MVRYLKLEGKNKCSNKECNNEYQWFYHVPQSWSSNIEAEIIPKDKVIVNRVDQVHVKNGYRIPLLLHMRCPRCDELNSKKLDEEILDKV